MQIKEIMEEWESDSQIDKSKLDIESLNSSRLHHKYTSILVKENLLLVKRKYDYNKLMLEKYVFYTEGAKDIKDIHKAPRGAVLKSEAEKYIQADDDVIKLSLEVAMQQEKVDLIKTILAEIGKRSYNIKNAIDFQKFMAGN